MTTTPAERFRTSNFSKGWLDIVDSAQFQFAEDMAALQFEASFTLPSDAMTAAANEYRRQGALAYRRALREIGEVPRPPAPKLDSGNLTRVK